MNHPIAIERRAILAAGLTAIMWGLTGIFVRLLPPMSPLAITAARLGGAFIVVLPICATSHERRLSLLGALQNPLGYVLASLLTGYYLLATAAFQLAHVAEVALLLSTFHFLFRFLQLHLHSSFSERGFRDSGRSVQV